MKVLVINVAALMTLSVSAQPLSFYETRGVVLSAERVARLADESYWKARLARQTQLTLVRSADEPPKKLDRLFAAISSWLAQAPELASDWVFVLEQGGLGARAALRPGSERSALELQPLEVDQVSTVEADGEATGDWRPRGRFRHAGFPGGVEAYYSNHAPICAAAFASTIGPGRSFVTVAYGESRVTFYVDRRFADAPESGSLVRYLGEVGVTPLAIPVDFNLKDMADLDLEQQVGDGLGSVSSVDALSRRERIAVKTAISSYFQSGTRSAEVDTVLPAGPAGEEMLYTLRFLPESNDVTVDSLGPATTLLPAAGPRSDVRRIPGFPAESDRTTLVDWLHKRYPALSVEGTNASRIVANADRAIDQHSGTAGWFAANYDIAVLDAQAADHRLAEAHHRPRHERVGLRAFSAAELRSLEAVLQRLGGASNALLRGTALVRQHSAEEASPFGDLTSHVQISGHAFMRSLPPRPGEHAPRVKATIVIYDAAYAPRRFIGGRTPDGTVHAYPPVAEVIAHELAHVISWRAPVQQKFEALIESVGATPFTRYAASNPKSEFFPEAFALYLLKPGWVNVNHPELYARVQAYAKRPRTGGL